ncbi:Uncharacterised protein [uncultured archaeon]|nr:Uncharacterised protein [uncultured archaeon]
MAFSKKQIFSLLVFVVMAGSMFVLLVRDSSNPNPVPSVQPSQGPATNVSYSAKGVQAKVLQVFPNATLIGSTDALDVSEVDAKLGGVPGILAVSGSEFIETQGNVANFRTSVRFASLEKLQESLKQIKDTNAFKIFEVFPLALISVPKDIEFTNETAGLSQSYSPPGQQAQSVVTIDTQKGDQIEVTLNAGFQGQSITSLSGIIERNLTSSPQVFFVTDSFKVAGMENGFMVQGSAPASKRAGLEAAKAVLESSADYNASLGVAAMGGEAKILLAEPGKANKGDLNSAMALVPGLKSYNIDLNKGIVSIAAQDENNYPAALQSAKSGIEALGLAVVSVEEPKYALSGTVELLSSTKEGFLALTSKASLDSGIELSVKQSVRIDANSIFVPDQNIALPLEGSSFPAYVGTSHAVGDDVNLSLMIVGNARTGIMQLQAMEAAAGSG